jgi:hypothetical protein
LDGTDIPIEIALSIVLAAAVEGADRQGLLSALRGPEPSEPAAASPALVIAFPAQAGSPDDDGPFAA